MQKSEDNFIADIFMALPAPNGSFSRYFYINYFNLKRFFLMVVFFQVLDKKFAGQISQLALYL